MNHRIVVTALIFFFCFLAIVSAHASKSDIGLTCDKEIIGVNRYIEVGNTISYTVEYLEQNKYRCSDFLGRVRELVSCSYHMDHNYEIMRSAENGSVTSSGEARLDHSYEILLTVVNGTVTEIETRYGGVECN